MGKEVRCYGKKYNSMKEWAMDFGITNSTDYITLTRLVKKITPEEAIEQILEIISAKEETAKTKKSEVKKSSTRNNDQHQLQVVDIDADADDTNTGTEKEEYSKNINPIYFTINDTLQLIEELRKTPNIHTINLIDFENIIAKKHLLIEEMNRENTINIFFYNARIYSNKFFDTIIYSNNINLQVLTYGAADQLVDHLIILYLGSLLATFPDKHYNIISDDNGYCSVVNYTHRSNINIIHSQCNDKDLRFKYSISKYISNNESLKRNDCITMNEFRSIFDSWLSKSGKININRINSLLSRLIEFHIVYEISQVKSNEKFYKFDVGMAKRIVENIDKA